MTHSTNRTYPQPSSDEKIIIDQEVRYSDGSVRKHRETVSSDHPAMEARLERARLEMARQLKIRDNDNAARGLLVGVIATTFFGLGIFAWYILTNRQDTEVTPTVVPAQPSEPSTPPSESSTPPNINITLPNPPAAERTETPPTLPTIIPTQPASPQPTAPSSQEAVPFSNPEVSAPEPTGSPAPSTSEESTESSAPTP